MRIQSSKKKKTPLNLNVYRNLHFRSLSSQKNAFFEIASQLLRGIPALGRIQLHYDIFPQSKRRMDIMNVGAIVDKYFSDSLTKMGIIVDDDYTHIDFVSFGFGGLTDNEYVLVTITETQPRKEIPMRILLDKGDIHTALETYVGTQGIGGGGVTGVELSVNDGEIIAEVMIAGNEQKETKRKGGRPAGSKNKPKRIVQNVDTPDEGSPDSSNGGDTSTAEDKASNAYSEDAGDTAPKEVKKTKNLFGESESQYSKSDSPKEEESSNSEGEKPVKKSSIFDQ